MRGCGQAADRVTRPLAGVEAEDRPAGARSVEPPAMISFDAARRDGRVAKPDGRRATSVAGCPGRQARIVSSARPPS